MFCNGVIDFSNFLDKVVKNQKERSLREPPQATLDCPKKEV
jgi:hypothetical protein